MKSIFKLTFTLLFLLTSQVCLSQAQSFEIHTEAFINGQGSNVLMPLDNGYIDLCYGDSILLVAKPLFPNSLESTGTGYSQTIDNVSYEWSFSDGSLYEGNDSTWFKPEAHAGYLATLTISDIYPQSITGTFRIRVAQQPQFYSLGPVSDSVCAFSPALLVGGSTATDTAGVNIPEGNYITVVEDENVTYLPDGSGDVYTATLDVGNFEPGATFAQISDLQSICITMEHSFLGDLEIWLTCPNGTEVGLVNSYDPGHLFGGFGGGATFLGDADDNGNVTPGVGWEYCFSSSNSTWGTMATEFDLNNTIPTTISGGDAMNPNGIYLPETSFDAFIGCPMNGDWTISVRDNQAIDDGYIFGWEMEFNSELLSNGESYQNYITEEHWIADPTIISGMNDTAIVVNPYYPGIYDYTYVMTDNFGCMYDTTVFLTVMDSVSLAPVATICDSILSYEFTQGSPAGGIYYLNGDQVSSIQPNMLPLAEYELVYSYDNGIVCSDTTNFWIYWCAEANLSEQENPLLSLYPNPSNSSITIDLNTFSKNINYKIYTLSGKLLQEKVNSYGQSISVDVKDLENGLYFIVVEYDGISEVLNFVKN